MTGSVNTNDFDKFFKITVQRWGTGENDCLSRIAQTSLRNSGNTESAESWNAIEDKLYEIQDYNNKYNEQKIKNVNVLNEGQEVLIPLEDAIDAIRQEFDSVMSEYDAIQSEIESTTTDLLAANTNVDTAFDKLSSSQRAYDDATSRSNVPEIAIQSIKANLDAAKTEYQKALEAQKALQDKLSGLKEDSEEARCKVDKLEENLDEYTDRKGQSEEEIDAKLLEIAGNIDGLEDDIAEAQRELDEMKAELENKKNNAIDTNEKSWSQIDKEANEALEESMLDGYTAQLIGFCDKDGNLIDNGAATSVAVDSEILSHGKVVASSTMKDGANYYRIFELEDGSIYNVDSGEFVVSNETKDGQTDNSGSYSTSANQQSSTSVAIGEDDKDTYRKVQNSSQIPQQFWDEISEDIYSSDELSRLLADYNSIEVPASASTNEKVAAEAEKMRLYNELLNYKNNVDTLSLIDAAMKNPEILGDSTITYNNIVLDAGAIKTISAQPWGNSYVDIYKADTENNGIEYTFGLAFRISEADSKIKEYYNFFNDSNNQISAIAQNNPGYDSNIINELMSIYENGGINGKWASHQVNMEYVLDNDIKNLLERAEIMKNLYNT